MSTTNSFRGMVKAVIAMDNALLLTADDAVYDAWLGVLGDYYKDDTFTGKVAFIKNALVTDRNRWKDLNDFFNTHMA